MKYYLVIFIFIIWTVGLYGQPTQWKTVNITDNFSLKLPVPHTIRDTLGFKVFSGATSNILFEVKLFHGKSFRDDSYRQRREILDGYVRSTIRSKFAKSFEVAVVDTFVSGMEGKFILMTDTSVVNSIKKVYNYTTLVNGHLISTMAYLLNESEITPKEIITAYYESIKINEQQSVKEKSDKDDWHFLVSAIFKN